MSDPILTGDIAFLAGDTDQPAEPAPPSPVEAAHRAWGHIFDMGLTAGRANAGNEELFTQLADAALGCLLDEAQPDDLREKAFANVVGFCQGWRQMMAVTPIQFLTRQQTARVQSLPRSIRVAWMAEYKRGVKKWTNAGGTMSGRRLVLPEIP